MLYCSWDMVRDRCNYLLFWAIFCPFTPNSPKNQNFKKNYKVSGDIIILHKCTKITVICYIVPEIWHVIDVIVIFHFRLFFALLLPNSPKNQNFMKMKKTTGDIIILHMCTKNYDQMMYGSWDMVRDGRTYRQMDGWTNGRTEKATYRVGCLT